MKIALPKRGLPASTDESALTGELSVAETNQPGLVIQINPPRQGDEAVDLGNPSRPENTLLGKSNIVGNAPVRRDSRNPDRSRVATQRPVVER